MYIQANSAGEYVRTIQGNEPIIWDDSHLCSPNKLTEEEKTLFHVSQLTLVTPPAYDRDTQTLTVATPALVAGVWTQQWHVGDLPPETVAENIGRKEANRIESLWQAAHLKEFASINGSAIGMVTMGILSAKPKCIAVQAWITTIWNLYYERKANGSTDLDYSVCGEMPHTVPELMAEVLV